MNPQVNVDRNNKCTLIESIQGRVKLIKRTRNTNPTLVTQNFSSLEDCLNYAKKNQLEINVIHSCKRKPPDESRNSRGS